MKALSVRQPYVLDIACGVKTVELRSRPIRHRGDLLICSTKGGDAMWLHDGDAGTYYKVPMGAQICVVEVVGCRPATPDDAEAACCDPEDIRQGMWAWEINLKKLVKPVPVSGKLNLFEVPDADIVDDDEDALWHAQFESVRQEPKTGYITPC